MHSAAERQAPPRADGAHRRGGGAGRPGGQGDRGADGGAGMLCVCVYVCVSI